MQKMLTCLAAAMALGMVHNASATVTLTGNNESYINVTRDDFNTYQLRFVNSLPYTTADTIGDIINGPYASAQPSYTASEFNCSYQAAGSQFYPAFFNVMTFVAGPSTSYNLTASTSFTGEVALVDMDVSLQDLTTNQSVYAFAYDSDTPGMSSTSHSGDLIAGHKYQFGYSLTDSIISTFNSAILGNSDILSPSRPALQLPLPHWH